MEVKWFNLPGESAAIANFGNEIRSWASRHQERVDTKPIAERISVDRDRALHALTVQFDATSLTLGGEGLIQTSNGAAWKMVIEADALRAAYDDCPEELRESLETAASNIREVASSQVVSSPLHLNLPQGQEIGIRDIAVDSAAIYAPGGRATYPSSVLMGAIPAREAGVGSVVLATPPDPEGQVPNATLTAAYIAGVDRVYAIGGAQAIYALARGTESVSPVDVIAGPGNAWVQEAKRDVFGEVGIDSIAGPSELMVIAGGMADPQALALDICAQAEHGPGGLLVLSGPERAVLLDIAEQISSVSHEQGLGDYPLAMVEVPDPSSMVDLANGVAPEHLQIDLDRADGGQPGAETRRVAERVRTAGCVFAGPGSATAFGDYAAGSNHVLPTGGTGRFNGPLAPSVFQRKISTVVIPDRAVRLLSGPVQEIASAEGMEFHARSVAARRRQPQNDTGRTED